MEPKKNNQQKVEFLEVSGGSGHVQVATALGATETNRHDVFEGFFFTRIPATDMWNNSSKEGNIHFRNQFVQYICPFINWLASPFIFMNIFKMLWKKKPQKVITTQFFGITPICWALRCYNFFKGPTLSQCSFDVYMTDFPSEYSIHYFPLLKQVSRKNKRLFDFYVPQPFYQGVPEDIFWLKHCRMDMNRVHIIPDADLPVRAAFRNFDISQKNRTKEFEFSFFFPQEEERRLVDRTFSEKKRLDGSMYWKDVSSLSFRANPSDFIWSIMLSSFPPEKAIFSYVEEHLCFAKETMDRFSRYYLILFCGRHESNTDSLFKKVSDRVMKYRKEGLDDRISIIPVTFQKDDVVANTLYGSDIMHTGSGGSSSFEHAVMAHKLQSFHLKQHRFIHSGCPSVELFRNLLINGPSKGRIPNMSKKLNFRWFQGMESMAESGFPGDVAEEYYQQHQQEILREGFIHIERGNVEHLLQYANAKIVTPDNIKGVLHDTFFPKQ